MGTVVTVSVIAWIAIGLTIAVTMIRRGHSPTIWLALSFYGPLLALLAFTAAETERYATPEIVSSGRPGTGRLAVLVGIDGSAESYAALDNVIALVGSQLGQLTLAHVIDYDDGQMPGETKEHDEAKALLAQAVDYVTGQIDLVPASVLLVGSPGPALARHANEGKYHMIAVGSRGHGATRLVLGSVAAHLSAVAKSPVLIIREGTSEWWKSETQDDAE